jgi:predicted metal-dependent hydrolase
MQAPSISRFNPLQIVARRMKFGFDSETSRYWHSGSPCITHFFTAFSMGFPIGEKFFIDSVKFYENDIKDEGLRERVDRFLRQEAQHSAQHRLFNETILNPNEKESLHNSEKKYLQTRAKQTKFPTDLDNLAITVAYEHITAMFADKILRYDDFMTQEGLDPIRALWIWHCIEETEHKSVAFDVYKMVGGGYSKRVSWFFFAAMLFTASTTFAQVSLLYHDKRLVNVTDWLRYSRFMFGGKGLIRTMIPDFIRYLMPSFHPWKVDNHELVDKWRDAVEAYMTERQLVESRPS